MIESTFQLDHLQQKLSKGFEKFIEFHYDESIYNQNAERKENSPRWKSKKNNFVCNQIYVKFFRDVRESAGQLTNRIKFTL